jgi:hypothetical protein
MVSCKHALAQCPKALISIGLIITTTSGEQKPGQCDTS